MGKKYEEMLEKYFKEAGLKAFQARFQSLIKMYNNTPDEAFPIQFRMFGFPMVEIESVVELKNRIKELGELIGMKTEVKINGN